MTPTQEEAIQKSKELLKQHFDCVLITCTVRNEDFSTNTSTDWYGDFPTVVGLSRVTDTRLQRSINEGI